MIKKFDGFQKLDNIVSDNFEFNFESAIHTAKERYVLDIIKLQQWKGEIDKSKEQLIKEIETIESKLINLANQLQFQNKADLENIFEEYKKTKKGYYRY